ncbi:MAG: hypothetical protein MR700_03660, partial [Selenomonadaceae bacterium]|nr:hypothetical protein [Selenomonadaceae bacterium]
YDLTTLLLHKTQNYANAQLETIRALRTAADPANIKAETHEEQSRQLRADRPGYCFLRHAGHYRPGDRQGCFAKVPPKGLPPRHS